MIPALNGTRQSTFIVVEKKYAAEYSTVRRRKVRAHDKIVESRNRIIRWRWRDISANLSYRMASWSRSRLSHPSIQTRCLLSKRCKYGNISFEMNDSFSTDSMTNSTRRTQMKQAKSHISQSVGLSPTWATPIASQSQWVRPVITIAITMNDENYQFNLPAEIWWL